MGIKLRASQYFVSTAFSAALSLLTLPLTTRILGPRDYGLLALGIAIAGIGAALAVLGIGYVVANRWGTSDEDSRATLVTTVVLFSQGIMAAWAVVATTLFLLFRHDVGFLRPLPVWGIVLAMAGGVLSPLWSVASDVLTVEGRASMYSASVVAQSVLSAAATLIALYAFHLRTVSLFIGMLAGAAVSACFGFAALRPYLRGRFDLGVRGELAQSQFFAAQLAESAQPFLERVLLSRFAGFTELGLYTHSQRYRSLALQATNAAGKAVWPVTLEEARVEGGRFPATKRTWDVVHLATACGGIAMTAFGDRIIALLTHDKFTPAWVYLAPWFVLLLLQLSAKPEVGTIYAYARGRTIARIGTAANVTALVATAALIPLLGIWGAVLALLLQAVVFRILVRIPPRRIREVPFQDQWALAGIAALLATWALKSALDPDLAGSAVLFAAAELVLLLAALPVLRTTLQALRHWQPERA